MKSFILISFSLFIIAGYHSAPEAAMVRYVDKNGKTQYVNTDYGKVPPEYADQVKDQLPKDPLFVLDMTAIDLIDKPRYDLSQRLKIAIEGLKAKNLIPSDVDISSGIVSCRDSKKNVHSITTENLSEISEDCLPQVETQIEILEDKLKRAQDQVVVERILVKFYTRAGCAECDQMETLLKVEKINYERFDVDTSEEGRLRYSLRVNKRLPYVRIGKGRYNVHGVDIDAVKKALKALKEPWAAAQTSSY